MSNVHVVISIPKTKIYFFLDVGVNSLRTTARKTCSKFEAVALIGSEKC